MRPSRAYLFTWLSGWGEILSPLFVSYMHDGSLISPSSTRMLITTRLRCRISLPLSFRGDVSFRWSKSCLLRLYLSTVCATRKIENHTSLPFSFLFGTDSSFEIQYFIIILQLSRYWILLYTVHTVYIYRGQRGGVRQVEVKLSRTQGHKDGLYWRWLLPCS